jgi:hypothetical protein
VRIIRSPRPAQYELLDRRLLQDDRLSFRARGLLAYLLSLPDGWQTDSTKLARVAREGRDAIRAALRELEQCGYLIRTRVTDPTTGTWSTEMVVRDTPEDGFPGVGFPGVGFPGATRDDRQR